LEKPWIAAKRRASDKTTPLIAIEITGLFETPSKFFQIYFWPDRTESTGYRRKNLENAALQKSPPVPLPAAASPAFFDAFRKTERPDSI
jgi:hypothetical protein